MNMEEEENEIWKKKEEEIEKIGMKKKLWDFEWEGGKGVESYIIENKECVEGKRVMDLE